jgi:hypothetical protein
MFDKYLDQVITQFIIIIIAIFTFIFIVYHYINLHNNHVYETLVNLNKNNEIPKLDQNKCSKKCCKHVQWKNPLTSELEDDKYIGSNFSCSSGCLCTTKDDLINLSTRGNNT